ncbi:MULTISPECIES: hypothetical protein [Nocardioides]|uniref:Uncharacterized protein n=1 Tax=Nocardioides vastitatis TaxID=2568655 RepID=A0ABW0ZMY8_9ACTN|nr:hypothetical protein [Nocardioides sp.]THJ03049.1 hypothetical protein E7Z54_09805 [Nocardioides sp.]
MKTMQEHLDTMVVEAATPDETTFGRITGRRQVDVWFAPGYYGHSTDDRIEAKLATLARLLWVARTKEYYRYKSELLGRVVRGEGAPQTLGQEARRAARNNILAVGESGDGLVRIESIGLFQWAVTLAPGSVPAVPESTLAARVGMAASRLIEMHENKLAAVWAQKY